jgi:hypothetical protein
MLALNNGWPDLRGEWMGTSDCGLSISTPRLSSIADFVFASGI